MDSALRTRVSPEWFRDRATVSAVSWEPTDDLDCADWIVHGQRLGSIGRGVAWWIGDWVNYGNARFGEKYSRAARITGYDVQTLMNMAYVASRFSPSRRRPELSWSHHSEVSSLETADQDSWLEFAEKRKLSVRGLRNELRTRRLKPGGHKDERPKPAPDPAEVAVCPKCGYELPGAATTEH